ncbi:MAG: IPTL-CTERM sorting domain-containing protein [Burkholderiales bacterium]|nr:IPTL-CTERM sorting domain-containing protein [Burkholderiales bacterium]
MKPHLLRGSLGGALALILVLAFLTPLAHAARVGVLSNKYATQTAVDFGNRMPMHSFTGIDTSAVPPTLPSLLASFDVLLVFEDSTFPNAPAVGNVAAAFAKTGRAVVLGTFYEQDRSDGAPGNSPHGWGDLEKLDPNTTDGVGTPYAPRSLDPASIRGHPLTAGVTTLTSAKFAGGNNAKDGTIVVATWNVPNALGKPDPAIAFRLTGPACVIHVAIAPNYPLLSVGGADFGGDFTRVWQNAFDFAASGCNPPLGFAPGGNPANVPTLSEWALVLTFLLVGGAGAWTLRRREARRVARRER